MYSGNIKQKELQMTVNELYEILAQLKKDGYGDQEIVIDDHGDDSYISYHQIRHERWTTRENEDVEADILVIYPC